MSKLINLEVISLEEGYAVLEAENGSQLEIDFEYLPEHLKEGRFLRFVISHTDFTLDKEYEDKYEFSNKINHKGLPDIPKGHKLAW